MQNGNITYIAAFGAGLLTFLSPCLLPLIQSFIAYITGVSLGELKESDKRFEVRRKVVINSLLFILGFSIVFVLLGLTASFIGRTLFAYQRIIRILGGLLITVFGLYLLGVLKLAILAKERRFNLPAKGATYFGSFLIGVTFAAAWTPCAGPILGSILVLAGAKASVTEGAKLLTIYSIGVGVPFFFTALAINSFVSFFNRFKRILSAINVIGGIFLIIFGILLMTDYLTVLTARLFGSFTK